MKAVSIVAENVKRLIKIKGYKQSAIATKIGMTEKQFSDLLNGRKIITSDHIPLLSTALGASPNDLFNVDAQTAS